MNIRSVSRDDIEDVIELSKKLEKSISDILKGNEHHVALAALMKATIYSMLIQCKTFDEAKIHRDIFMQLFDFSIEDQFKVPDFPEI